MFGRRAWLATACLTSAGLFAVGCSTQPGPTTQRDGDRCIGGRSQTTILSSMAFAREQPKGVTNGFDVDGIVSDADQSEEHREQTCRQSDYLDPEGRPGIDNQLAKLLPLLESVTAADLNLIIEGAIENGQLLTAMTLDGIDNLEDDPCVELTTRSALGTPTIGSDGELDPSQTFELDSTGPVTHTVGTIRNGVFEAGPLELRLLVVVFAEKFVLNVQNARIRLKLDGAEKGRLTGVIGGGVKYQALLEIIKEFDLNQGEKDAALGFLRLLGDLDRDSKGQCTSLSVGVTLGGRRAFLAPGPTPTDGGVDAGPGDAGVGDGGGADAGAVDAGPKSADEEAWERDVLPIARETCLQCHAISVPGRPLLTTYASWVQNRNLIKQVVVTEQRMPPATVPLTDARRRALEAWLTRAP